MLSRKMLYYTILIMQIFSSHICYSQEYYEKGNYRLRRSDYQHALVSGFDHIRMTSMYLPGFTITGSLPMFYHGLSYEFKNSDNKRLAVKIGVYPTIRDAEEAVLDYLNDVAGIFSEGNDGNVIIGDNSWYYEIKLNTAENEIISRFESIIFIRKNAIVGVFSGAGNSAHYYPDLLKLAESIDNDIMNGAPYIKLSDTLNPPVIHSVSLSKSKIQEGEESIMTIYAYDPAGHIAHYRLTPGPEKDWSDPKNVFRIYADRNRFPDEPFFETHKIEVWIVNNDNFFSSKAIVEVTFLNLSSVIDEGMAAEMSQAFTLFQNIPNPFNPSTVIGYKLYRYGFLSLRVYDLLGREVAVLDEGEKGAGRYEAIWNGMNSSGKQAASGMYLYRLESGGQTETGKMTLVR